MTASELEFKVESDSLGAREQRKSVKAKELKTGDYESQEARKQGKV